MPNELKAYLERFKALNANLRMALVAAAVVMLAVTALMSRGPDIGPYTYLYTNLDAHDGGEIVQKLKEKRIPYRLDGTSISVPESQVLELRLELAQTGLPRGGGVGFEIFDRPSYGQSDFVQQKNYHRALQGELERTIGSLGAVQTARVHLVLPEKRLFRDNEEAASASVVVKLRAGRTLGEGQAQGIVHLVSSSVPGLAVDRVTLLDDAGRVLSQTGAGSSASLDYKTKMEKSYEQKIRQILERAVGMGHASVQVSAEVDFNQEEKTEESYDPERTVVRSEQSTEEKSGSTPGIATAGIPGTRSNLPGAQTAAPASMPVQASSSTERKSGTKNYEVARTVSRTVTAPGRLLRLNVAVAVDGTYEDKKFVPRDDAQIEALSALVKQSMGFDPKRGDQFEVRCIPFANEDAGEATSSSPLSFLQSQPPAVMYGALGAGAFIVFMVGFILARRGRSSSNLPALVQGGIPRTVRELEAALDGGTLRPVAAAGGMPAGAETQALVMQQVMADNGKAAAVIRTWLQTPK